MDTSSAKLEIGHILFLDLVGYTTMATSQQRAALDALQDAIRGSEQFREAEQVGNLLKLPTGDGMALIFYGGPEAPVKCAIEVSKALLGSAGIRVRMGVHSGPVSAIMDINGNPNVAGAGINTAQRVMDCGDAGHILLSKRVADDLAEFEEWRSCLTDLGEVEVKHGARVHLVNLYREGVGNQAAPKKLRPVTTTPTFEKPPKRSSGAVAVLQLENRSGLESETYFVEGMTEALVTDLAKMGLKVISRGSMRAIEGQDLSPSDIGSVLGVDTIVEGSVLRDGDTIRISARLLDAKTEEYLWADRYERSITDVLSLQDEMARTISTAIGQKLRQEPHKKIRQIDPEVFKLELRARHHLIERTEESYRLALSLFEEATRRDPTYVPALLGRADTLNTLGVQGMMRPSEAADGSLQAAQRALELDSASADAHRLVAFVHWQFAFNWDAAIAAYERSLELNPNSPLTKYWYGVYLGVIGFFDEAEEMLEQARMLDPLSLVIPWGQGFVQNFAGRYHEAVKFFDEVLAIDRNFLLAHWSKGLAFVELGRYEEGIEFLERAVAISQQSPRMLAYLGYAYGRGERPEAAEEVLRQLDLRPYVGAYFRALVFSGLRDYDQAMDQLELAYREGDTMLRDLRVDPPLNAMRGMARFQALLQQMAFPSSRATG